MIVLWYLLIRQKHITNVIEWMLK